MRASMDAPASTLYVGRMRIPVLAVFLALLVGCHHAAIATVPPGTLPAAIPPLAGPERIAIALRYVEGTVGTGAAVGPRQCVFVHYTGWLRDGTRFDSSRDTMPNGTARTPIGFPLGVRRVIAGWDLGFGGMRVGGQRRLFIPYALAYGESGRPPVIPERADLIFDLEVMAVTDTLPTADAAPQRGPRPQCPTWAAARERKGA